MLWAHYWVCTELTAEYSVSSLLSMPWAHCWVCSELTAEYALSSLLSMQWAYCWVCTELTTKYALSSLLSTHWAHYWVCSELTASHGHVPNSLYSTPLQLASLITLPLCEKWTEIDPRIARYVDLGLFFLLLYQKLVLWSRFLIRRVYLLVAVLGSYMMFIFWSIVGNNSRLSSDHHRVYKPSDGMWHHGSDN